jgi:hypothetical protein
MNGHHKQRIQPIILCGMEELIKTSSANRKRSGFGFGLGSLTLLVGLASRQSASFRAFARTVWTYRTVRALSPLSKGFCRAS